MEKYALAKTTPMMSQWYDIKASLTDEIVFCRVGDFYELFYDDAERASKILDIQLTKRKLGSGTYPMAGVPVRSLESYIARLVAQGFKVAIIDQLEDAKSISGKKAISRGLTRIITKGTLTDESMLTPGMNNYLASISIEKKNRTKQIGFAVCDISTGDLRAGSFNENEYNDLIRAFTKYAPVEILYSQEIDDIEKSFGLSIETHNLQTKKPHLWFDPGYAKNVLFSQFKVKTLQGYGLKDGSAGVGAVGALIKYLSETQFTSFPHIKTIRSFDVSETMILDTTAIKGLELFQNSNDQTSYASLLELMDETITPMGGRLLRHWVANPLAKLEPIEERLNAVKVLNDDNLLLHSIRSCLSEIGDIERLATRISMMSARPDELIKLAMSLEAVPALILKLDPYQDHLPIGLLENVDPCESLTHLTRKIIQDNPSSKVGEGNVIKLGNNEEFDKFKTILKVGKSWLDDFIEKEKKKTNIGSLRIKQNNVFGYFIEISKKDISLVPEYYVKKQVMVNASRYFSEELKDWETDIISAEIKIHELENKIYENLLSNLGKYINVLQTTSKAIAQIDCFNSFAYIADKRNYNIPNINTSNSLIISNGRHPVIENLNQLENYVPNDINLEYNDQRLMIITGPNFSGKSSLLRATALIVIMAQMGSFVPAEKVELGIVDRIFTRIGASDNLVAGQSTFMMEMIDAANLVNNCTEKSLIIADELGRGTSTYDGLAIAWSISEYLHNIPNSPKTMIATHYHQLAELENLLNSCVNYHFEIEFDEDKPIFNHLLQRGSSDKSFGVEVAKLSGLPDDVIERARKILNLLETKATSVNPEENENFSLVDLIISEDGQTSLSDWFLPQSGIKDPKNEGKLIKQVHPIIKEISKLKLEELTPLEALQILEKLKRDYT